MCLRHWVHLGPDFVEGGEKMSNKKNVVPRAEKLRWLKEINPERFSQSALLGLWMVVLFIFACAAMGVVPILAGVTCQLDDIQVEQLFWVVTNMHPRICVKDLDVSKKCQLLLGFEVGI